MVHKTLPPIQPNDFGRNIPPLKSNSDPESSIKFRKATKKSISPRQKRSTISANYAQHCSESLKLNEGTCAGNLEQIILLEFFEHAAFNLYELIGHE
jgi:hypothetical protein